MRAILGLLILGALFLMAATWQSRWTEKLQAQREREFGVPAAVEEVPDGWSTLVIGRPSGADPFSVPQSEAYEPIEPRVEDEEPFVPWDALPARPDFSYTVRSGDILGRICANHYDSSKPWLVDAVARYNGINSDSLRVGMELLLPDYELLLEERAAQTASEDPR